MKDKIVGVCLLYYRIIGFFVYLNSLINLVNSVGLKNVSVWFFFFIEDNEIKNLIIIFM